ncbi:uncharacterized protein LOC124203727 [Daphnia pulex]|uniref:uncharacterized protein LOC124203727 n=1 Tax=Daphnia pulex TaxID=6669 RepID=UPI001EE04A72|nr:uncharacterized protein LOC124203727 [Daphnia pulex]
MEMATKSIRYILTILFVSVACCNCQRDGRSGASSSWEKLQILPDPSMSMVYGNFLVEIYEHANNGKATTTDISQKKFYYSPLALLDHKSAVSSFNKAMKQAEVRFSVEMWNDKVQNEVMKYLSEFLSQEIKYDKVRVIPLEKVILTSNTPTSDYTLSPVWTNYDKSKTLKLSLSCYDQKICDDLANEMRSNPKQFDHFKLLYSLSSQASNPPKKATFTIDSVTSGQLVSTLLQKFEDKKEVFLTASDEKKMLTEMANKIRMDTLDDSEIASPETESQILITLKGLLVTSTTTIKDQGDKKWDSVFWNDDNYRPDKTTKTLNGIINKMDTETKRKLTDMFQEADNSDPNSWADVGRISSVISKKMATDSDSYGQLKIEVKEDAEKLLQESRSHVQWNGDKFVPKPMQLSRINLDKFRDQQSLQDRNVLISYTTAELSAPIKIMEQAAEFPVTDTAEQKNLKDQLKAISNRLDNTINDLFKTKNELTKKCEGNKQEWVKTKADLTKQLDSKLNVNSNQLRQELKVSEAKLKREFSATFNDFEKTKTTLASLRMDLSNAVFTVKDYAAKLNERTSEIVDIGKMPTSCTDLQRMGHKLSGFFSVKGSKKMEIIYCDFYPNENEIQTRIGYVDVKSAPVYFQVTRDSSYKITNTPIPFDLQAMNEGNAMDLKTGKFTAPRPGIYYFSFTGHARISNSSPYHFYSSLYLNGYIVGSSFVSEERDAINKFSPLTVQATLNLKMGDQVWVQIQYYGLSSYLYSLHDDGDRLTHFTGFLLEEDIEASR